ncbi:MAG TPA: DUF2318 domain-containing protein [Candidatus Acidoferrum sp.]|nr:DUF2318 domain-containing protein [Candidatus Acidoferrum sp.]
MNPYRRRHKRLAAPLPAQFRASVLLTVAALMLFLTACASQGDTSSGGENGADKGGDLTISIADLSEDASYYPIEVDKTEMEVVAVLAPDGTVRTAFNTCQVCYDSGRGYYEQSGDKLVCQNCGNQFTMAQVGVIAGGCNPWPISGEDRTVTEETVTISYDFLKESKEIFANWK